MKWLIWTVVALIAAVGIVASIGFFLPVAHEASRSAEFNHPPEAVFELIADPATYGGWWQEADVKTAVIENAPPLRLVTKIVDETQFGGTWTFEVAPTPGGSRLTITERGEIYNLVFRALAKYAFGYTGTMESFLSAAKKKLN
jgi:hypothetical protein